MKKTDEKETVSPKKSKKPIGAIIIVASLLVVAGAFVYVKFLDNNKKGGFPGGFGGFGGNRGQNVVSVKTMVAENIDLLDYVRTNGEISAQTSVDVFPNIGGKITRVNVSLGSRVSRGQVIAYVDPSSPGEIFANSPVTSPISGTVTANPLKVGTKVSSGTAITTVGDVDNLQLTISVPERYVASLKVGLKADVTLESYGDEIFTATVSGVSPLVDSISRTKKVILNFDQQDSRVQAGMFAKVKLWTDVYSEKIAIPIAAITEVNKEKYVFIVKGDSVEKRYVQTGKSVDNFIQVTDGIELGETVVVEGMRVLSDGAKIKDITNGLQTDYSVDAPKPNGEVPPDSNGKKPNGNPPSGKN